MPTTLPVGLGPIVELEIASDPRKESREHPRMPDFTGTNFCDSGRPGDAGLAKPVTLVLVAPSGD